MMSPRNAQYRIRQVVNKTGVNAATLRSWERRYGVPKPQRGQSAYRLYSDSDVLQINRMRALCESGLSPAEAAKRVESDQPSALDITAPYSNAVNGLVAAATAFDAASLHERLRYSLTLGDAVTVFENVIGPALRRVGDLWERGRLSVGQEHLFSDTVEYALRDLLRLVQPVDVRGVAVLSCFPDELHTLGLYGVGVRLAGLGVRTVVLGARTPPEALGHAVERLNPTLVGLSVTMPPRGKPTELMTAYAQAVATTPWLVGGAHARELEPAVAAAGGRVISHWPHGFHQVVSPLLTAA